MTIARGQSDNGEFLLLGIGKENLTRLVAGHPITMRSKTHPGIPEGLEIVIMYGEPKDIKRMLEKEGAIDDKTRMSVDPRLDV